MSGNRQSKFGVGRYRQIASIQVASLAAIWVLACWATTVRGQGNSGTRQEKPNSQLTEGLLDLIQEPEAQSAKSSTGGQVEGQGVEGTGVEGTGVEGQGGVSPGLRADEVGLGGADLNEQSDNPLESIRQSMLIAAGFLRKGVADEQTQELQSDIVSRLDELIEQLETAENSSERSSSQSSQAEQQSQSQQQRQPRQEQPDSEDSEQEPPPSSDAGQDLPSEDSSQSSKAAEDQPGLTGENADVGVDLRDPRQLQQSAWGQLPERVRKQMQSRMVERFLPSYREQIEAYFQALLRSP